MGLRQKGVHPPIFAPKRGTPRKRLNEATVPPGRPLFPVVRVSRRCKTQQGMRENLWDSTVGTPCLLSRCGVGSVKRVYHEGRRTRTRFSRYSLLLYRSKQYFSGCEPRKKFRPRRGRITVRLVLKWRHPQLIRVSNTTLTKS